MGLAAVLGEVWASPLPLCERRRLAARVAVAALGASSGGGGGDSSSGAEQLEPIGFFEEALMEVAALMGKEKLGISAAKESLRLLGAEGESLARRLARLSKVRNSAAHPDVALLADIRALGSGAGKDSIAQGHSETAE